MRNSEFNAHNYLAATRHARTAAARVPTFGNVSRIASRLFGAVLAVVFLAGAL